MEAFLKKYLEYYKSIAGNITNEEILFFTENVTIKEYDKKDFFLKENKVQLEMGFIVKGLLRRYYIDEKGKKITTYFLKENDFATDYPSFIKQIPTKYYLEFLEPTTLACMPYQKIQEGFTNFKSIERFGRIIAEEALIIQTKRVENFLFKTAEERYLEFLKENKNIISRINLSHLASLLGIERQSLSRIRKRVTSK
jgi:CRP/FNR family transcriptional regulator, anaerobic regulatory protein